MTQSISLRGARTVTHYYVTDTIELNPVEFQTMGAPDTEQAFLDWLMQHLDQIRMNPQLSELTRMKLSKLGYYTEDRERRVDLVHLELSDQVNG